MHGDEEKTHTPTPREMGLRELEATQLGAEQKCRRDVFMVGRVRAPLAKVAPATGV